MANRSRKSVAQLIEDLKDPNDSTRHDAVGAAGDRRIAEAAPVVHAMFLTAPAWLRASCAETLGKLRYLPAVDDLIKGLQDSESGVVCHSGLALSQIRSPEAIEALVQSQVPDVVHLFDFFIRLGDRRTLPRLRKYLKKTEHDVDRAIALGCGEPSLAKVAKEYAARWREKIKPRRSRQWGEGFAESTAERQSIEWLAALEQCGWLGEVPAREAARLRGEAKKPGTRTETALAPTGYDAECIENSGDYRKWVVPAFTEASFGELKFRKVHDSIDCDNETATLSLTAGNRTFTRTFDQPDDYVSDEMIPFMNKVAAALGHKKRFHLVDGGDQIAGLVFVTPKTFARAKKLGLV
jgi:hypothetical protein